MTDTLTLISATGKWIGVKSEERGKHYVAEVLIAGNSFNVEHGETTIEAQTWMIEGENHPVLLVEARSYYERMESVPQGEHIKAFYSDDS